MTHPLQTFPLHQGLDPLYGSLPMAVLVAGADQGVLYANSEFFTLTECRPSDLALMNFQDVLSVFCLGVCEDLGQLLGRPGFWHDMDKPIAMADGSLAWTRVRVDPLVVEGRACHRLLVDNVTRYKVAIEGLLNRKNLYQSIVETRPDLICCFLPDWSLTYANQAAARHFGLDRQEAVGADFLELIEPDARERFSRAVVSITSDNPIAELEYQSAQPPQDGPPRFLRWIIQGFFYKTGHIKDYQATGLDVTGQKVTESQFMHADRLVSLGTLVSEVAHEISNPNNFIMLNAPLVLDLWHGVVPALERQALQDRTPGGPPLEALTRDMPQLLQGIIEGSERIRDFVRQLKDYARKDIEGGYEILSVNDVVQSAVLLMSKTIGMHTSRLAVRYGSGLPLVRGRRQRLEQIVVNLVQNACHALTGPHQGIEIETLRQDDTGDVLIEVRDEGVGIRPEDLPMVTEPFFSTKRDQGGTGLGLSISLSIAREHGGRLEIASQPGKGATARVALPPAAGES
ncbi:Sensor protein ZraS [Fundidesulfovibrio magnetotacticus]|uniref:histidine kinase n=1 Tax=Fundidesulfovibrio magnetotacticus TaxID=2730080 RepID=A0A6V8LRX4_9BACT|nr:ATP-binding protein [Fundidesulfovibrio magnetotacticus]GFK92357.1 Sensor protein ZraS [Fundidesulfovibrio magnetotacticus]